MAYQNPAGQSTADRNRQRNEMQRNIIMLEADKGKKNVQKMQLDAEIREAKKARERAEMELQARQLKLQKIEQEMATVDVSIKGLKKKLNEL
jgi:septal ring factor EnvC (AmiA/AmiB activator)